MKSGHLLLILGKILSLEEKTKTASGFKTKKEAERACNELIHQFNTGSLVDDKNFTLSEYLQEWLENTAKQRVRETTFTNYKRAVNSRIIPVLGSHKLKDLKPLHGQRFVKSLIDEGLSPAYIEYIFIVLKGALEDAVRWELLFKTHFNMWKYLDHEKWSILRGQLKKRKDS